MMPNLSLLLTLSFSLCLFLFCLLFSLTLFPFSFYLSSPLSLPSFSVFLCFSSFRSSLYRFFSLTHSFFLFLSVLLSLISLFSLSVTSIFSFDYYLSLYNQKTPSNDSPRLHQYTNAIWKRFFTLGCLGFWCIPCVLNE